MTVAAYVAVSLVLVEVSQCALVERAAHVREVVVLRIVVVADGVDILVVVVTVGELELGDSLSIPEVLVLHEVPACERLHVVVSIELTARRVVVDVLLVVFVQQVELASGDSKVVLHHLSLVGSTALTIETVDLHEIGTLGQAVDVLIEVE